MDLSFGSADAQAQDQAFSFMYDFKYIQDADFKHLRR